MKIFFVNTPGDYPNQFPPLGLMYLASVSRQAGYDVFLYDLGANNASHSTFINELTSTSPDIICLSIYTTQIEKSLTIINEIKTLLPNVFIIVGGPHISALPGKTISKCNSIDCEVFGEGEITLIEIIQAIQSKSDYHNIAGTCFFDGNKIIQNSPRDRITDLDSIPFPAFDLIKRFNYSYDKFAYGHRVGVAVSSRGCPYNCTFCNKAVFGSKYMRRSPQNLIDELIEQKKTLDIDELYFVDDLFVTNEEWLNTFLDLYKKSNLNMPWKCLGRVDQVESKTYKRMKDAGCFLIQFGIEAGDEQILKSIKKGITIQKAKNAVASCQSAGINAATYFILGHPGETYKTITKTISVAQELNADICHFFVLVPFPGTYNYQFVPDNLKENWNAIRYYHKNSFPISLCQLEPEELYSLEKQARYEFYGRIGYFLRNIVSLRYPLKITLLKTGIFSYFSIKKIILILTSKRIFVKIKQKSELL